MSEWQISLPHRSRSEPFRVDALADYAAEAISDPEERAVTRALGMELLLSASPRTFGDAVDLVDTADGPTRRALLDRARERAGLRSTEREEQRRTYEAANPAIARPKRLGLAYSPRGAIVDLDQREADRLKAEAAAESRRHQREAREAARRVEGAELERHAEAVREQIANETPRGLRP